MTKYAFDNTWEKARLRLRGIEALFDPGTIQHMERCGIAEGWHCLEVGAGGGSITEWLCQHVGTEGSVLATDIDTRFVEALDYPNLAILRHDIVKDVFPEHVFDLIHTRMVLCHLPERDSALRRMVAALKPGGWLICEALDNLSMVLVSPTDEASQALYLKIEGAVGKAMAARGHMYDYGRRLSGIFCSHGLMDVQSEGRVFLRQAGMRTQVVRLTVEQLREDILGAGLATEADIEAYFALLDNPTFTAVGPTLFAAWGRRAAA